jgi:hypothetical protein
MQAILQLFRAIETVLPPQVYIPLFAVIGVAAIPSWFYWLRTKQIKGQLRGMQRATGPDQREAHKRAAFELAAHKPRRLAYLADEALRLGLKAVYEEALKELAEGGHHDEHKRLEQASKAPAQVAGHPLQEAAAIERLVAEGLLDAARERLRQVRARFPDDPDLAELEKKLL